MATQTWKEYIWEKVYETGPKKKLIYIQNSSTDYFCLKKMNYILMFTMIGIIHITKTWKW